MSVLDLFRLDGKIALVTGCKRGVISAGRWAQIEDLTGSIVYRASAASDYANGEILTIDGGWMER